MSTIAETDNSQNKTLVSYTYGTGADNGQVMSVTDGLSGVTDTFAYDDNPVAGDGGIGQPSSVVESWSGGGGYTVGYTYTLNGERANVTYGTGYGTNRWQYADYTTVGGPSKPSRVPQTLRQLDSNGNPTPEEFHYLYDPSGRLLGAGFAMTPQPGYTPPTGQPYYNVNQTPWYRAHAVYDNAAGGQLMNLWYTYENQVNSLWVATSVTGFSYSYDPVTLQKSTATFLDPGSGGTGWVTNHTENYTYDPNLDYLTSASYNDGLANPTDTWAYDAAGNRISDTANPGTWTYDDLNRMTASPGQTYSNDILGNRLSNSSSTYGWDHLNRMTTFTSGSNPAWSYTYRADGMRTLKSNGTASTSYAYDGQMGIEDIDLSGTNVSAVTDYAIGARTVERIAKTSGGSTNVMYPLYDGHGNMVSTLGLSGVSFSTANQRSFDAWGNIRGGSSSGDPKGRYCANLGHKQDDESGLIYMRARYYEPASGRFVSEDPSMSGRNWFLYACNKPTCQGDENGRTPLNIIEGLAGFGAAMLAIVFAMENNYVAATISARTSIILMTLALNDVTYDTNSDVANLVKYLSSAVMERCITAILVGAQAGECSNSLASMAVMALTVYSFACLAAVADTDNPISAS